MKAAVAILFSAAVCATAQETVRSSRGARDPGAERITEPDTQRRTWFRGMWVPYEVRNGLAFYEDDILIGTEQQAVSAARSRDRKPGRREATANDEQFRWPDAPIQYRIDPDQARFADFAVAVRRAIQHWEVKTGYRFQWEEAPSGDHIVFQSKAEGCYATAVGRGGGSGVVRGAHIINLDRGCDFGAAVHEIGHIVGLFHEQSRPDRDEYIRINLDNIKDSWKGQFRTAGAPLGPYDYASIMHYPAAASQIQTGSGPAMETIPEGIPVGQRAGLSPGDVEAVERMRGAIPADVIVSTNPAGLQVQVDGAKCTTPCRFTSWAAGEKHQVAVALEQTLDFPYYFARWSDNSPPAHEITINPDTRVYTAHFTNRRLEDTAPDLVVVKMTGPASATAGGRIAIEAEVKNRGRSDAGEFRLGFYLSANPVITRVDQFTGWRCRFNRLDEGRTGTCTGEMEIPDSTPAGTYYLGAVADDLQEVIESDELNNGLESDGGAILISSTVAPLADLVSLTFTAPVVGVPGAALQNARLQVRNNGQATSPPFRTGFYLSPVPGWSDEALYTGWVCREREGLIPGETQGCTGQIGIPEETPPGQYYLIAVVDDLGDVVDADRSNNIGVNGAGPILITREPPKPDLSVDSLTSRSRGVVGEKFQGMTVRIRNTGEARAGRFRVGFYLSTNAVITAADTFTGWSCTADVGMAQGDTWSCSGEIGVPSSVRPGVYYFGAIVDDLSAVDESDEANNWAVASTGTIRIEEPPEPDLTVVSFTASNTAFAGGRLGGMRVVVRNIGGARAGRFRLGFYLSRNDTITSGDRSTGWSCTVDDGLAADQSWSCAGEIGIPEGTSPGTYYLGVIADDEFVVRESNEANNTRSNEAGLLVVGPAPKADLIVTVFNAPISGVVGSTIADAITTVKNQGNAASGPFRIGFYYSTNTYFSALDQWSGWSCQVPDGLAAGATYTCRGPIGVPASLSPGQYYIAAVVDDRLQVAESDEDNNVRFNDRGRTLIVR